MKSTLRADLRRLGELAFHRADWGSDLVRRIHRLRRGAITHPDLPALERFLPWLLAPLTIWPVHLEGLGRHIADRLESGRQLDPATTFLLSLLGAPPDETAQAVTMQHEHLVQPGDYGALKRPLHVRCTAEVAGFFETYESAYCVYCQFTHGALRAALGKVDEQTDIIDTKIVAWCVVMMLEQLKENTPALIPDLALFKKKLLS